MKPSIPKGTRDFSAIEVAKRNYIFDVVKDTFEKFGFAPIETPSFEKSETLMGKYGEEGDRLIFKILNSGEYMKNLKNEFVFYNYFQNFSNKYYSNVKNKLINIFNKYSNIDEKSKKLLISDSIIRGVNDSLIYENKHIDKDRLLNTLKELVKTKRLVLIEIFNDDIFKNIDVKYIFEHLLFNFFISNIITPKISEKALRYDLTVPFARYVVQHRNELTLPFKRYQMQAVWRADRPQKGRFREFYQCDADVVGSKSLWQEVDFIQLYDAVFDKLGLKNVSIKINNRKILAGIAEVIGAQEKLIDFTVALDKLDKIGKEGVITELKNKDISASALEKLAPLFDFSGDNTAKLSQLEKLLENSKIGMEGIADTRFIIDKIEKIGLETADLLVDITLARGLNYYTGSILEVTANDASLGSIGGGGRYDDLTGIFGLKNLGGMGISFGLDRIYLVLEELNLFDKVIIPKPDILFINFGEKEALYALLAIKKLRKENIRTELYPDAAKMKKQMVYADKRAINFVVLAGGNEIENKKYTLKNMQSGKQQLVDLAELIRIVKS